MSNIRAELLAVDPFFVFSCDLLFSHARLENSANIEAMGCWVVILRSGFLTFRRYLLAPSSVSKYL